ncbi:Uncharacterised protein [Escherichia coli]|uniref:Uncharacterized protein n=1 Tax=Escherichia coli TaxID=562 RepID=A0A376P7L4_ECOLX|nr:Uncharacterised protein [Escherichia coli]
MKQKSKSAAIAAIATALTASLAPGASQKHDTTNNSY